MGVADLSSAKRPDRLWEPTNHLYLGTGVRCLVDGRPWRESGHSHLEPRLKMHTSSRRCTVILRLTKIISYGITFVSRNVLLLLLLLLLVLLLLLLRFL